jgi:hypothetical protein
MASNPYPSTLKTDAIISSVTLASAYQITQHPLSEEAENFPAKLILIRMSPPSIVLWIPQLK